MANISQSDANRILGTLSKLDIPGFGYSTIAEIDALLGSVPITVHEPVNLTPNIVTSEKKD